MDTGKGFNIIPGNEKQHQKKQFGMGVVDLNALSSVIIDDEGRASLDMGALHAKSDVEKGIKFFREREEVPHGHSYWVAWVAMGRGEQGAYFSGLTASEMFIDRESRKGYKRLSEHVNAMDKALKGKFSLSGMPEKQRHALKALLEETNPEAWGNSSEAFFQLF